MRYLTEDLYKRMQFFPMFYEEKLFQNFVNDYEEIVDKTLCDGWQYHKEDMKRLLPDNLKNKIFDSDGNLREIFLDEALYNELVKYRQNLNLEWKEIWQILKCEREKVESTAGESIKKLISLHMHDQQVMGIRSVDNKIFVELEEKEWGKITLIFIGVEKFEIKADVYPCGWLYQEIFPIEHNKYEFNVLFTDGEITLVFNDFEIVCEYKQYLNNILSKYTAEKIDEKIEDIIRATQNTETGIISNDEILRIKELCFGDREIIQEILMCVAEKRNFGGSKNLSRFENDISLIGEFIYSLLYDTIHPQKAHMKAGFYTCKKLSKAKRVRILKLLSETGLKYLLKLSKEAFKIFEGQNKKEKLIGFENLNKRLKRRYGASGSRADEIFKAVVGFIKEHKKNDGIRILFKRKGRE